jgi:EAL domain-containing protein (putative c-di-GMP-specific phosphodiesterase class I)
MLLTKKRSKKVTMNTGISIIIALAPILVGGLALYVQAERALEERAARSAHEAVRQLEPMLDSAQGAANSLLGLAGSSCVTAQLLLRDQTTRRPFVRSTGLTVNGIMYCSSLQGDSAEVDTPENYTHEQLWLLPGNDVTPDTALLIYRAGTDDRAALAAIDGRHLSDVLRSADRNNGLTLKVGGVWMSTDGRVHDSSAPHYTSVQREEVSERYGFSVTAGYDEGATWHYSINAYREMAVLFLVLGVAAGGIGYKVLGRQIPPSRELKRALGAGEFIPFVQPLVDPTGHWIGVEVLMRWQHPVDGLVRPDLFIPYAEHSGLIIPMTRSIMLQVAQALAPHALKLPKGFHIGFNISSSHCHDFDLVEACQKFLLAFPPDSIVLVLEITERELIEPDETTHQLFHRLDLMGVQIALDDFGTGHSSLDYLRKFHVDYLKIDKSFVSMIGKDALSIHILECILDLSQKVNLKVVAEGVETQEQFEYLRRRQVDFFQGYLFSRPLAMEAFVSQMSIGSDAGGH